MRKRLDGGMGGTVVVTTTDQRERSQGGHSARHTDDHRRVICGPKDSPPLSCSCRRFGPAVCSVYAALRRGQARVPDGRAGKGGMRPSPLSEYQEQLLAHARAMSPGPPPPPWAAIPFLQAGGVLAGGWTQSDQVVLISSDGYSVSSPRTGERLVRDRDDARTMAALAPDNLSFLIPATGERISVFGVWGGDGSHSTADGWAVDVIYPWWPEADVLLWPPRGIGSRGYLDGASLLDGVGGATWRGCGFSPSGDCLMLLTSDGAHVYVR